MRKINIGVSVAPPNVVHTSPYVAKELGFFAKRCIEPNIIQFEGGQSNPTYIITYPEGSAVLRKRPDSGLSMALPASGSTGSACVIVRTASASSVLPRAIWPTGWARDRKSVV